MDIQLGTASHGIPALEARNVLQGLSLDGRPARRPLGFTFDHEARNAAIDLACEVLALLHHQAPHIQDDRRAIEFISEHLGQRRFSATRRREQEDSTGHGLRMPIRRAAKRICAKPFKRFESA